MKVLITGAFGNLGLMCVEQALQMGYEVRCFDLNNAHSKKIASLFGDRIEVLLGDLQNEALLNQLVDGVDAIIHNASVLPPVTDNNPTLAHNINVVACGKLIKVAENAAKKPTFIFPSSVTVFGIPQANESPRTSSDPVQATDNYTSHKLTIEKTLMQSSLPWVILRVGVSVDTRTLATDRKTFKQLLDVRPDNPFEYVHPKDVAYAMCNAAKTDAAKHKILLLGGGKSCQITQRDFLNTAFTALGFPLPISAHGNKPYYTHWMDTTESQQLLNFQRHPFADYQKEMTDKLKPINYLLFFLRWPIRVILPLLLRLL